MSTIVFIGSVGRSGTTLLERTLATSPELIALGEMVHLWDRGVRDREPCGCGADIIECPFWGEVGRRAFGGWDRIDLGALAADRAAVDRNRYIPFLLAPRLAPGRFRAAHARLRDVLERLYAAIRDVTAEQHGHEVVLVDSSKHPSYLFLLRTLRESDVRVLHVVRDPRGVAHSWAKQVARPETGDAMEQLGTLRACARWTSHNLLFQLAGWIGLRRTRLPYERFTRDPTTLADGAARLIGRPVELAIDGSDVVLGIDHTVSGNPMRFQQGTVSIRPDEAWRAAMPARRRRLVGTLTTPLRQVYAR